jgi:1-acyl-sn-glycerol-3-phosphate acyltransferase
MLIFPEGTTTNGRAMMKFKKGAFMCEKPLRLYSMIYGSDFIPCLNLTAPGPSILITLSQFVNRFKFLRFKQAVDPLWILQKHGLKPGQEDNWEVIAKEVKDLMCFAFDLINDNSTFRDKCAFDCEAQNMTME